jgi:glycosyltransferase involved in cell wall biosynthesis
MSTVPGTTASPSAVPATGIRTFTLVSGDFVKTAGMDRANYALGSYLLDRGDRVHFAAYRLDPKLAGHLNAVFHRVKKPLNSYLLGHPVLSYRGRRLAKSTAARGSRVVVNGGNCRFGDVNWLHHLNVLDLPRTSGGLQRRVHRHLAYRLYIREDRAALRMARQIITTCERNKADLLGWLDVPPERVHTVYYGTDPAIFHPPGPGDREAIRERLGWPTDLPVVAFVGALGDLRKGFDTLFEAWSELCRDPGWDARLVVAGAGAELPGWKQGAADAGLSTRVEFLGFRRDVPEIMRAIDAHVLPSRYEGYSLVTQEALCCGAPAFITRTAGIAERYPGPLQDLLIPDPEDAHDLASRLRRWRDGREALRPAVAAFSEQLRSTTWDDMAARFVAIVEGESADGSGA